MKQSVGTVEVWTKWINAYDIAMKASGASGAHDQHLRVEKVSRNRRSELISMISCRASDMHRAEASLEKGFTGWSTTVWVSGDLSCDSGYGVHLPPVEETNFGVR